MNRWLKRRSVRVMLILLGVFVVISVAVRMLLPAERWKELALEQLEARTGLKATAGPASIQFPWPLGLSVEDLHVEDPEGNASYERLSLDAASILIRADLMSVVRRQPQINQIKLDRPRLSVALRKAEPAASDPQTTLPPASSSEPSVDSSDVTAVLSVLDISDGELQIELVDGRLLRIDGIQQRAGVRVEGGRAVGNARGKLASIRVDGEEPLELPELSFAIRVDSSVDPQALNGNVEIASVEMAGATVSGSVRYSQAQEELELDLKLSVEAALTEVMDFAATQQPLPDPIATELELLGGRLSAELSFSGVLPEDPDPELLLKRAGVTARIDETQLKFLGSQYGLSELLLGRDGDSWKVELKRFAGRGIAANATLRLPLMGTGEMGAQFDGSVDVAELRRLAPRAIALMPAESRKELPPESEWPQLAGIVQFRGTVVSPLPAPEDPSEIALEAQLQPKRLAVLPVAWSDSVHVTAGTIRARTAEAELEALTLAGPGFAGSIEGAAWGWPDAMELDADVHLSSLDLDKLRAAAKPDPKTAWRLPGIVAEAHAAAESDAFVPPANLGAELRLDADQVLSNGYELRQLQARGSLREQRLSVPEISGRLGDGQIESKLNMDWTQDPPIFDAQSHATDVPASEIFRPIAGPLAGALSTRFTGELNLLGPMLTETDAVLQAISGLTELSSEGGTFQTEAILGEELSGFLGQHYQDFQSLDFSSISAGLRIEAGQLHFDRMLVEGDTRVSATGAVGFDGRCDYQLDILLPSGATPALGDLAPVAEFLRDDAGRIGFSVAVTGPAKKPKLQIDWESLARRASERGTEKLQDDLKDKAKSLLDGLFSGKKGKG